MLRTLKKRMSQRFCSRFSRAVNGTALVVDATTDLPPVFGQMVRPAGMVLDAPTPGTGSGCSEDRHERLVCPRALPARKKGRRT
jgi:hypothetical protein